MMTGFTDNYIRVQTDNNPQLYNTVQMVRLTEFNPEKEVMKGIIA